MTPAAPPERIADERTPIADAVAAASLPCRTVSGATARRSHAGRCA